MRATVARRRLGDALPLFVEHFDLAVEPPEFLVQFFTETAVAKTERIGKVGFERSLFSFERFEALH